MEINPVLPMRGENPVITFPDSLYGGNGDRMIITQSPIPSENPQSIIYLPEGGRVTVEIIFSEAAGSSIIDLLQRQPNAQTLLEYANHNIGYTWVSEGYPPNTNVEFGIWWYYNSWGTIYQGYEAGAIMTQVGSNKYQIGFEAAGDDWDYNELVIEVTIEDFELLVIIEPPTISTDETALITVKKQFYDGRVEDFPADQLFEVGMMEGCAAGVLVSGTDTSNYFNGVTQPVIFIAADSLESDEETVKIGVGVVEQNPLAKMQTKTNVLTQAKNRFRDENNTDAKDDEISIDAIIIGSCFGGDFDSDKRSDAIVVVGNGCGSGAPTCSTVTQAPLGFKEEVIEWTGT